jgi:hypothetical protein
VADTQLMEQIARAPKALRDYLANLEKANDGLRGLLKEQRNGGASPFSYKDVRADGHLNHEPFRLPEYAMLHVFDGESCMALDADEATEPARRGLVVRGVYGNGIVVRPQASNMVRIAAVKW